MIRTKHLPSLSLESGHVLNNVPVAYGMWGALNAARDNVILVCHALTGSADLPAWWPEHVGPGRLFNTDGFCVMCANVPGSPYGSVSSVTPNPDTGLPYGPNFPPFTIRDTVSAHRALLDALGITGVAMVIGGSMGGMQALEWAFHGDFVRAIVPIAVGGRDSAWCIGISEAQRHAIYADPNWRNGEYDAAEPPERGLATARMIAMISYRSSAEFDERFGRDLMPDDPSGSYAVASYLRYQGVKLVRRFDANCYVHLTLQMDTHDVGRGRVSYEHALRSIQQPALIVGISSDILYPVREQEELARLIPNGDLAVLDAPYGHDSFLIEDQALAAVVGEWMKKHVTANDRSSRVPPMPDRPLSGGDVLRMNGTALPRHGKGPQKKESRPSTERK